MDSVETRMKPSVYRIRWSQIEFVEDHWQRKQVSRTSQTGIDKNILNSSGFCYIISVKVGTKIRKPTFASCMILLSCVQTNCLGRRLPQLPEERLPVKPSVAHLQSMYRSVSPRAADFFRGTDSCAEEANQENLGSFLLHSCSQTRFQDFGCKLDVTR